MVVLVVSGWRGCGQYEGLGRLPHLYHNSAEQGHPGACHYTSLYQHYSLLNRLGFVLFIHECAAHSHWIQCIFWSWLLPCHAVSWVFFGWGSFVGLAYLLCGCGFLVSCWIRYTSSRLHLGFFGSSSHGNYNHMTSRTNSQQQCSDSTNSNSSNNKGKNSINSWSRTPGTKTWQEKKGQRAWQEKEDAITSTMEEDHPKEKNKMLRTSKNSFFGSCSKSRLDLLEYLPRKTQTLKPISSAVHWAAPTTGQGKQQTTANTRRKQPSSSNITMRVAASAIWNFCEFVQTETVESLQMHKKIMFLCSSV